MPYKSALRNAENFKGVKLQAAKNIKKYFIFFITDEQTLQNIVLQGDTFGSLLGLVQVDNICQEIDKSGLGYKYKNFVPVSMLGLIDNLIGISKAGYKAQQMNAMINLKTA